MQQQLTLPQALQLAAQSLQKGELQQAEQLCRQILQVSPNEPNALHLLGGVAYHAKYYHDAIQLMQQAVTHAPALLDAYSLVPKCRDCKRTSFLEFSIK